MPPKTPLINPQEYFEQVRDATMPGLGVFALYVITTGFMLVSIVSLLMDQIENAPRELEQAMNSVMGTTLFALVIASIIALLGIAAVLHYMTRNKGSSGTFTDAVAVAGWAYAPNVIAAPFSYLHARQEIQQLSFDGSNPDAMAAKMESLQAGGSGAVPTLILLGVVAWSVYILAHGIAGTHDVDVDEALVPALIVGVIAFIAGL